MRKIITNLIKQSKWKDDSFSKCFLIKISHYLSFQEIQNKTRGPWATMLIWVNSYRHFRLSVAMARLSVAMATNQNDRFLCILSLNCNIPTQTLWKHQGRWNAFKMFWEKNIIYMYWLIHIDFKTQEIFPPRLASLINPCYALVCLLDLQLSREKFPVFLSQCGLISISKAILPWGHLFVQKVYGSDVRSTLRCSFL